MSVLGKNLVPLQTQFLIKKDRKLHRRGPVNYKEAAWIGILYSVEDRAKHDAVTDFVERLKDEDKKVEVMTFLGKNRDNYDFKYFRINSEQFDTLLAWAGFYPELQQQCIIWHGIGRRFDYWDPEESVSPYPSFPKILK